MIIEKHPAGRPAQAVLATPEPAAVADYYAALLGWGVAHEGQSEPGAFTLGGEPVAGLTVGTGGWLPYLAVDDLADTLDEVRAAGGTAAEPTDGPFGRTAVVVDPTATELGLWESGSGPAVRLWGEPGAVVWFEQKTRDQAAATAFLAAVLGYAFFGASGPGTVRLVDAEAPRFGGVMEFDDRWAADHPAHWLVYVQVDDVDAAVARGDAAGGSIWFPAFETPLGRMAYLRDPAGNALSVVALSDRGVGIVNG